LYSPPVTPRESVVPEAPPPLISVLQFICMYYVYILKSKKDNSLYIGCTNNLKRRFVEHAEGKSIYTRRKLPVDLIYYEAYKAKEDATMREAKLKKFKKSYAVLKKRITYSLQE